MRIPGQSGKNGREGLPHRFEANRKAARIAARCANWGEKKASPEARPPRRNTNVTGQEVCPSIDGSPARIRLTDYSQKLAHHPVAMFVVFPIEFNRKQVRIGGSRFQ